MVENINGCVNNIISIIFGQYISYLFTPILFPITIIIFYLFYNYIDFIFSISTVGFFFLF
jgi:hypothetical protein